MTTPARGTIERERLAALVGTAAYGSVLVLAAVSVVTVGDVTTGHGLELVGGVGLATWVAHLFGELVGRHILTDRPLHRGDVTTAALDASPILAATLLPALVLLLGRVGLISEAAARAAALVVTLLQLLAIGLLVTRFAPGRRSTTWAFAGAVAGIGVLVGALAVRLGH